MPWGFNWLTRRKNKPNGDGAPPPPAPEQAAAPERAGRESASESSEGLPQPGADGEQLAQLADARWQLRQELSRALTEQAHEFTRPRLLRIAVGTFNVGEKIPRSGDTEDGESPDYATWLHARLLEMKGSGGADLVAVGLQEVDMSPGSVILERGGAKAELWESFITNQVGAAEGEGDYTKVVSAKMAGLLLLVFVKDEHVTNVANLRITVVRTGKHGWANKGAIATRMTLYGRKILFVNAHLEAHTERVYRRNKHYDKILSELTFELGQSLDDALDLVWPQMRFAREAEEKLPQVVAIAKVADAIPGMEDASSMLSGSPREKQPPAVFPAHSLSAGSRSTPTPIQQPPAPPRRRAGTVNGRSSPRRPANGDDERGADSPDPEAPEAAGAAMRRNPESQSSLDEDHQPERGLDEYDYVFWFGDLNYRLAGIPNIQARAMIAAQQLSELLQYDQLSYARLTDGAFSGFAEAQIVFPPTYKFDEGRDTYDSSRKQRMPSWTDRVLWKVRPRAHWPPTPDLASPHPERSPSDMQGGSPHQFTISSRQNCSLRSCEVSAHRRGTVPGLDHSHLQLASFKQQFSVRSPFAPATAGRGRSVHWESAYSAQDWPPEEPRPSPPHDASTPIGIPVCGTQPLGSAEKGSGGDDPFLPVLHSAIGHELPRNSSASAPVPVEQHKVYHGLNQVPVANSLTMDPMEDMVQSPHAGGLGHPPSVFVCMPDGATVAVRLPAGAQTVADLDAAVRAQCAALRNPPQKVLVAGGTLLTDLSLHLAPMPPEDAGCPRLVTSLLGSSLYLPDHSTLRVAERTPGGVWELGLHLTFLRPEEKFGAELRDPDPDQARHGVAVVSVAEGSPAARSGLCVGMGLVEVDGCRVSTAAEALQRVEQLHGQGDGSIRAALHPPPDLSSQSPFSGREPTAGPMDPRRPSMRKVSYAPLPRMGDPARSVTRDPHELGAALSYRTCIHESPDERVQDMIALERAHALPAHRTASDAMRERNTVGWVDPGGLASELGQLTPCCNYVIPLSYSAHRVLLSDHRPVSGAFELVCLHFDVDKAAKIVERAATQGAARELSAKIQQFDSVLHPRTELSSPRGTDSLDSGRPG
eukprot:TRINITY_DN65330_c0_g1_i1.p1 TRINITY_DN65330_c0_g1~~TRINITY_DN65330_c0_g1_i1.p1  ORF type:complete len:1099 (+),score=303.75 TRINITY_DN65330_c0_g1_i1:99-3395(+)